MEELEALLAKKIEARSKINMEIFAITESLTLLKDAKK